MMQDFLGSVSLFGWGVIAAAAFGLLTVRRAAREALRRPWKARPPDGREEPPRRD